MNEHPHFQKVTLYNGDPAYVNMSRVDYIVYGDKGNGCNAEIVFGMYEEGGEKSLSVKEYPEELIFIAPKEKP